MDAMDEMWCTVLASFPHQPDWLLVKERPGVYRMGGPAGKKVLCRISHGGLQVRVGGGWMPAMDFLDRYGPTGMNPRALVDDVGLDYRDRNGTGGACVDHLTSMMETPPSMERLLVPTKCWAQRIVIIKTPDLREQRRLIFADGSPVQVEAVRNQAQASRGASGPQGAGKTIAAHSSPRRPA